MARMETTPTMVGPGYLPPAAWVGDYLGREHLIPGGGRVDPAAFVDSEAVVVTVGAAGAAIAATSIPVAALRGPIPAGTVLDFGTDEFARTTAAVAAGATAIPVAALGVALEAGDTATYSANPGRKHIRSGTPVGRTYAERDASLPFGPAAGADDEVYLLAWDITDAARDADADFYRPNSIVKENFLPAAATADAAVLTKIRGLYRCVRGGN